MEDETNTSLDNPEFSAELDAMQAALNSVEPGEPDPFEVTYRQGYNRGRREMFIGICRFADGPIKNTGYPSASYSRGWKAAAGSLLAMAIETINKE